MQNTDIQNPSERTGSFAGIHPLEKLAPQIYGISKYRDMYLYSERNRSNCSYTAKV